MREEQEASQWQERDRRYPLTPAPNKEIKEWRRGERRRGFKIPEEQGKGEQEIQEIRRRRIFLHKHDLFPEDLILFAHQQS